MMARVRMSGAPAKVRTGGLKRALILLRTVKGWAAPNAIGKGFNDLVCRRMTGVRKSKTVWSRTIGDATRLSASIPAVIALRMAKLAKGGVAAKRESRRMVSEKIKAAFDANADAAKNVLSGRTYRVPGRILALYRKRVRNNLRRLSKKG